MRPRAKLAMPPPQRRRSSHILVVPAAGFGTRMQQVGPGRHKEMLDVGGVPAIQRVLADALDSGLEQAALVLRPGKEDIRDHFTDKDAAAAWPDQGGRRAAAAVMAGWELIRHGMNLEFFMQEAPRGECDAVLAAADAVRGRNLAVHYPDNIQVRSPRDQPALAWLLTLAGQEPCAGTSHLLGLMEVDRWNASGISDSGRVDLVPPDPGRCGDPGSHGPWRVARFLDKGQGDFVPRFAGELRTCGIHLAGPDYPDVIRRALADQPEGEVPDNAPRRMMLASRIPILGARLPGRVFDTGNPAGYAACLRALEPEPS